MKSLIHEIPGLPVESGDIFRIYVLTSWTTKGINNARAKVKQLTSMHLPIQQHCGENGLDGDWWWSFVALMRRQDVERHRHRKATDRYGMIRHVWTEDKLEG